MAKNEDATLFRPMPLRGGGGGGGGGGMSGGAELDPDNKASLWDLTQFAWRGALRRKTLTAVLVVVGILLTIAAEKLAPRTYNVEAHILVVRSGLSPSLSNGEISLTPEEEKREAKEFEQQILSRENIVAIVSEGRLVDKFAQLESPIRKLMDKGRKALAQPDLNDAQKFDSVVGMLDKELKVTIDSNTIIISLDWPDPAMARDIVQAAVHNFQDARYNTEVAVIPEAIKVLESHAAEARDELEQAANDMRDSHGGGPKPAAATAASLVVPKPAQFQTVTSTHTDPAVAARLAGVQAQIRDILDQRQQKLTQLNGQLSDLSATYGPAHPAIIAVKSQIEQAQQDSPALINLRRQETQLQTDAQTKTVEETKQVVVNAPTVPTPAAAATPVQPTVPAGAGDATDRFQSALRRYEGLRQRIDSANIEEQTAEANFKHKYIIVKPAELPVNTKKPVSLIVAGGGVVGSLLLILIAATGADYWSGLFFEARRVRDKLSLPILGEARDEEPGDVLFL